MSSQPAILIYNPRSGRWRTPRLIDGVLAELGRGYRVEAQATEAPGHATALARRAAALGSPVVFAFGGDGTLRETSAGLLGTETALGPLPGGTSNVVALFLGLPIQPVLAARALCSARVREIDVGLCGEEPFLMQASTGLDAHVLQRVRPPVKRWVGRGAVAWAGLREWWRFPYGNIELVADGHPLEATFFAVCNLPLYGGAVALIPNARPDDGRLDLLLFRGKGRRAALSFATDLVRGRHVGREDVSILPVTEVLVPGRRLLQIDGDALEMEDALIRLETSQLKILEAES